MVSQAREAPTAPHVRHAVTVQGYWDEPYVVHGDNEYLRRFDELDGSRSDVLEVFGAYRAALERGERDVPPPKSVMDWRTELVGQYAWAIPCDEALDAISRCGPIVEIGAGTGYWAHLLQQRGVDVLAYDLAVRAGHRAGQLYGGSLVPMTAAWGVMGHGGARRAAEHPDCALFLCWPPYGRPMAYNALCAYRGQHVIYIGEGEEGCTGDDAFHALLARSWEEIESVTIPCWWGIRDYMTIYRRKE